MAVALGMLALISVGSAVWATPVQRAASVVTVPPIKSTDETLVYDGDDVGFEILLSNPDTASDTWTSTLVTDTVDSYFDITDVNETQGSGSWTGQNVTFTVGDVAPGNMVTLTIDVTYPGGAPSGYPLVNRAYLSYSGYSPRSSNDVTTTVAYRNILPIVMKLYTAP